MTESIPARELRRPMPVRSAVWRLADLFAAPRLVPAAIQRGIEWEPADSTSLLRELDVVFSELIDEGALEDDGGEAEEDPPKTPREDTEYAGDPEDAEETEDAPDPLGRRPDTIAAFEALGWFFFGTMVLMTDTDGTLIIYDGQQRTTVLTILFSVLRDLEPEAAGKDEIDRLIWADAQTPRLHLDGRDPTLRRDIQERNDRPRPRRGHSRRDTGQRILRIRTSLHDRLKEWSLERRRAFFTFLVERVAINVLFPDDSRLARQIFVSTNLYGKRISRLAILKGLIVECARSDEEATTLAALWSETAEVTGDGLERFMRAVDVIERAVVDANGRVETQKEHWHTDLGEHLAARALETGLVDWMNGVRNLAHRWREMETLRTQGGEDAIARNICRLDVIPWTDWQPLALYHWSRLSHALHRNRLRAAERAFYEELFDALPRRCMAITLGQSDVAPQAIFARAVAQSKAGLNPLRYRSAGSAGQVGALHIFKETRQRIDRVLRSQIKSPDIAPPLLKWLESRNWRPELTRLLRDGSVEHVMPRNPQFGIIIDSVAYDAACYALGNLALLDRRVNKELTNKPFPEKLPRLREQAGLYETLRSVIGEDDWDAARIERRSETLRTLIWDELRLKPPE
ncbi:MAG: DUF262 domain-containing HNH endonuclease family protein [Hyphomicrobiaceae bacterium]